MTGVPGWLGTRLAETLIKQGRDVRCLTLPEAAGGKKAVPSGAGARPGDLTRPETLKGACAGAGTVFHCAAVLHPGNAGEFFRVNTGGTGNLIEEAARSGVERFIYVSSNSAAGCCLSRERPMTEDDEPRPYKKYGRSKLRAEEIVRDFYDRGLVKTTIIRPCWFYGPGQPARQTRFFKMIKSGRPVVFGDGRNLRSLSYVDNVIDGLLLAERSGGAAGETYWIADREPYPTIRIYETIAGLLGVKLRPRFVPRAVSGLCEAADTALQAAGFYCKEIHVAGEMVKDIACGIEKARRDLGYSPAVGLEEGVRRSIEWCANNGIDI